MQNTGILQTKAVLAELPSCSKLKNLYWVKTYSCVFIVVFCLHESSEESDAGPPAMDEEQMRRNAYIQVDNSIE